MTTSHAEPADPAEWSSSRRASSVPLPPRTRCPTGRERPQKLLWKTHANKPSTLTATLSDERVFDLARDRRTRRRRCATSPPTRLRTSSSRMRATSAIVWMTFAGSLSVPRRVCGARNGASVSTRMRSMSTARAACRRCSFFGYVMLPAKLIQYPRSAHSLCDRGVAAEAVDHDAFRRTLIQDSKDLGPRVTYVDDHRLPGLVRQRDVRLQRPDLVFFGRSHPEEVQTALPDGHHPGVVEQLLDPRARRLVEVPGIVGMHPRRGEDTGDRIRQLEGRGRRRRVHADAQQAVDTRRPRGLDHQ